MTKFHALNPSVGWYFIWLFFPFVHEQKLISKFIIFILRLDWNNIQFYEKVFLFLVSTFFIFFERKLRWEIFLYYLIIFLELHNMLFWRKSSIFQSKYVWKSYHRLWRMQSSLCEWSGRYKSPQMFVMRFLDVGVNGIMKICMSMNLPTSMFRLYCCRSYTYDLVLEEINKNCFSKTFQDFTVSLNHYNSHFCVSWVENDSNKLFSN